MRRAIFLDRDGTVNMEKNYLHRPADWTWTPRAPEAIRGFNRLGFLVIVITNQSGIARGYYRPADVDLLHGYVNRLLEKSGAHITAYYYCPHHPDFGERGACRCRKPEPGLIYRAGADFAIDLPQSYLIGDKISDLKAGLSAGVTPILVTTGYGQEELTRLNNLPISVKVTANLYEAYLWIAERETSHNRQADP